MGFDCELREILSDYFGCALHLYLPPFYWLHAKHVTATWMALLILLSLHPLANIWSAVLKLHTICFTARQKPHCVATDQTHVFQIQNDVAAVRLKSKKPSQLGYRLCFDSAAQDEHF